MSIKRHNEQTIARMWYVEQGRSQKEIAQKLQRTEKTISAWVQKYGWKNERTARLNSFKKQESQIQDILHLYGGQTLKLLNELKQAQEKGEQELCLELNKKLSSISDHVSKWNKRLDSLHKDHKASLATYIWVMEDLFEALRLHDEALYLKTLDFQQKQLQKISISET